MMNRKPFAALTAAALLGLTLLAGCGQKAPDAENKGEDLLAAIQAKGEIVVAMEGTWAPWTYHDESDQLVGYDVEVARAIADKLGVEAVFAEGEWDALLAGMESGRYDIMVNGVDVTPTARRSTTSPPPTPITAWR